MYEVQSILDEVTEKYSEWFEMAGDQSPALMCQILGSMLIKEKNKSKYLKRRLDYMYKNSQR